MIIGKKSWLTLWCTPITKKIMRFENLSEELPVIFSSIHASFTFHWFKLSILLRKYTSIFATEKFWKVVWCKFFLYEIFIHINLHVPGTFCFYLIFYHFLPNPFKILTEAPMPNIIYCYINKLKRKRSGAQHDFN